MKHLKTILLCFVLIFCFSSISYADASYHLTEKQADELICRFDDIPYVLDYCGCCDFPYGSLVKIESITKTLCDYNENYITLKFTGQVLAYIDLKKEDASLLLADKKYAYSNRDRIALLSKKNFFTVDDFRYSGIITTNYTWGFENGVAVPLGNLEHLEVDYSCDEFIHIPYSEEHAGYLKFYESWIAPYLNYELVVTANQVNVREDYRILSPVVGQVNKGAVFKIVDRTKKEHRVETYHEFWYLIKLPNGKTGWILGEFTDAKMEEDYRLKIIGDKVNIRSKSTLKSPILFQLNEGSIDAYPILDKTKSLYYIDEVGDYWYKIKVGKKEGWVFGQLTSQARFIPD